MTEESIISSRSSKNQLGILIVMQVILIVCDLSPALRPCSRSVIVLRTMAHSRVCRTNDTYISMKALKHLLYIFIFAAKGFVMCRFVETIIPLSLTTSKTCSPME